MPTEPFNLAFVDASCIHCATYRRSCDLLQMYGEIPTRSAQSAKRAAFCQMRNLRKMEKLGAFVARFGSPHPNLRIPGCTMIPDHSSLSFSLSRNGNYYQEGLTRMRPVPRLPARVIAGPVIEKRHRARACACSPP